MSYALASAPVESFLAPAGVRLFDTCVDTGTAPSEVCPQVRRHFFAENRPPRSQEQDLWQIVRLDRNTGQLATEYTPADAVEERVYKIYPPEYRAGPKPMVSPSRQSMIGHPWIKAPRLTFWRRPKVRPLPALSP
jgi:hypothetical protein